MSANHVVLDLTTTVLVEALDLIRDPQTWGRIALARDAQGLSVPVGDPGAVKFCAYGAIGHVEKRRGVVTGAYDRLRAAMLQLDPKALSVMGFNDTHPHKDVVHAFELAITGVT